MAGTPVCQITAVGIIRPAFADCLGYAQSVYRSIYGQDVYLGADSQDGQLIALFANAIHDANGETVAAYNAFSPSTAQGAGLSSVVKISGIKRKSPTYSSADLVIVGQVGATITAGAARDADNRRWNLPATVLIPAAGQILVTATCADLGAIQAPAGSISTIATPTLGWQSVTNPDAASPGLPVETDNELRQRQAISTALPAQTILESMGGALSAISGVSRIRLYENDGTVVDANGIPAHAIAVVVEGGDATTIGQVIAAKKSPGVGTYGDVLQVLTDAYGIPHPIRFFRPSHMPISWHVTLRPRRGYTTDIEAAIRASLAAFTNAVDIGGLQMLSAAYPAANLTGTPQAAAFEVVGLEARRFDTTEDAYGDIAATFAQALVCDPADVTITTVTT